VLLGSVQRSLALSHQAVCHWRLCSGDADDRSCFGPGRIPYSVQRMLLEPPIAHRREVVIQAGTRRCAARRSRVNRGGVTSQISHDFNEGWPWYAALTSHSQGMWVPPDVRGLFSKNVGSFLNSPGLGALIFSWNLGRKLRCSRAKRFMLSRRYNYAHKKVKPAWAKGGFRFILGQHTFVKLAGM
jgi:hypothetical protein